MTFRLTQTIAIATTIAALNIAVFQSPAEAATLTQWNFNSNSADGNTATGSLTPNIGTGSLSLVGGITSSFASGTANGGSSDPATTDNSGLGTTGYQATAGNKTAGVRFKVSTVGQQNIVVSFDQRFSNTSSKYSQFQYSLDGTNFVDFGSQVVATTGDTWFNNQSFNLSSVIGANNNANFAFQIVSAFAPNSTSYSPTTSTSTYASTGTWRFDMVTVNADNATPIPTPALLPGLVGFGLSLWQKRKGISA
jgi:hypothetical protein